MLGPRRQRRQIALTKENLDACWENDPEADGLHFLFGLTWEGEPQPSVLGILSNPQCWKTLQDVGLRLTE